LIGFVLNIYWLFLIVAGLIRMITGNTSVKEKDEIGKDD